ncbi:MAG: hypothetical protein GX653_05740 [Clostridiales bacterium]|nr:hypothetical protein [Clostridiales bacterium]
MPLLLRKQELNSLNLYDVTHSVNVRDNKIDGSKQSKETQGRVDNQVPYNATATISISDLLDVVNGTFRSVLSKDVQANQYMALSIFTSILSSIERRSVGVLGTSWLRDATRDISFITSDILVLLFGIRTLILGQCRHVLG